MQIDIISPDKKIYSGTINLVQVPGSKGPFTVLNNHAPIVSTLEKGTVRVVPENAPEEYFDIEGGVIEVKNNNIIVLVESL